MSVRPLRLLLVEDRVEDAELVVHALTQAGFDPAWQRVDDERAFVDGLSPELDVILADFHLPQFGAPRALELVKSHGLDVPLIVVSGSIGEETAVSMVKNGAADYLLKDRLARLGQAVERAIEERRTQREKRDAESMLAQSEERMRFALRAAQAGLWEADLTTGVTRWSETLEALHGMSPGSFPGRFEAFIERIHPDDRPSVLGAFERATRERTDANILYRTQWPDGSVHWLAGVGRIFYDHEGRPFRSAGVGLDVTERRVLEDQYRQSQKMEAIGQLAGGVAHDFNNLLTAIRGYCELLTQSLGPTSPHIRDLNEIERAADRATSLTRQLLAFSRRQILEPKVLDLCESVSSIEPMLRRLIGEDVDIVVRCATTRSRVKADPGQMEQVVMNLAVNARDAMPNGGTLILEVSDAELDEAYAHLHAGVSAGSYVMLAASDTGTGMDAQTSARVFEPFFTTKEPGHGTGLGLSTVYGIVKQSGGHVAVYSEPGRGSTFKVYLPRVDAPAERAAAAPVVSPHGGSETILVVEDESAVRELVRRILERQGYRVLIAPTPREALDLVDTVDTIDLLVSDVVMPEMSGRVLAEKVAEKKPGTRVLFMSGYTDNVMIHSGVLDASMPFLQKPFTPAALGRKVREVLDLPHPAGRGSSGL